MSGIDQQIAHLSNGHTLLVVLVVALALGLRHATDPGGPLSKQGPKYLRWGDARGHDARAAPSAYSERYQR